MIRWDKKIKTLKYSQLIIHIYFFKTVLYIIIIILYKKHNYKLFCYYKKLSYKIMYSIFFIPQSDHYIHKKSFFSTQITEIAIF